MLTLRSSDYLEYRHLSTDSPQILVLNLFAHKNRQTQRRLVGHSMHQAFEVPYYINKIRVHKVNENISILIETYTLNLRSPSGGRAYGIPLKE